MKKMLILLFFVGILAAISMNAAPIQKHPNLAAAQELINKAFLKITAAQKANEFDLGGHAGKAKDYLDQATSELKLAAVEAEENKGEKSAHEKHGTHSDELATNVKHPNLAQAQQYISEAFDRISAAQKANEFDLGGHAAKAKDALEKASEEIKLADQEVH